ncbi:hypothetical protein ACLKA6_017692 [Drosophila palustris]
MVIVKKKVGANQVCVDYRQLNKMVLKDCLPVPVIDDVLEKLQNAKYFTVMDLENRFSSQKCTAFITKQGLYESLWVLQLFSDFFAFRQLRFPKFSKRWHFGNVRGGVRGVPMKVETGI